MCTIIKEQEKAVSCEERKKERKKERNSNENKFSTLLGIKKGALRLL